LSKEILERENFCPIPFLALQMNPLGNVSACCYSNEYNVGNVKDQSLEEIWNGEKLRNWRKEFLTGDIKICAQAMKDYQCHKMWDHLKSQAVPAEVQTAMPRRLDLRLNGQCNLECIMCTVWQEPNHLYDVSDFWDIGPEKIFPYLMEVDMLGGEPFIQKDTYRMIDEVSRVNKNCTWGFITNGQYNFNDHMRSYLDKITLRHIHISLDAIHPDTYAKIRLKGQLEKTLRTIDGLLSYRKERNLHFAIFASICIQKDNWRELGDFVRYCEERSVQPILQYIVQRPALALTSLELGERKEAFSYLSSFGNTTYAGALTAVVRDLEQSLSV
jgi:MoaA/NifB/PqqE/SkfB family radical SAM enzyme